MYSMIDKFEIMLKRLALNEKWPFYPDINQAHSVNHRWQICLYIGYFCNGQFPEFVGLKYIYIYIAAQNDWLMHYIVFWGLVCWQYTNNHYALMQLVIVSDGKSTIICTYYFFCAYLPKSIVVLTPFTQGNGDTSMEIIIVLLCWKYRQRLITYI